MRFFTSWHQYENPDIHSLVRMVVIWLCDFHRSEGVTLAGSVDQEDLHRSYDFFVYGNKWFDETKPTDCLRCDLAGILCKCSVHYLALDAAIEGCL